MDDDTTLPPLTLGSLWAIRSEVLPRIVEAHRSTRDAATWGKLAARIGTSAPRAARRGGAERAGGAVAVIPLTGVITPAGRFSPCSSVAALEA